MAAIDALRALQALIESDSGLQAFSQWKWGKAVAARIVFKHRVEIRVNELPLVLITRPRVTRKESTGAVVSANAVRLYAGFHQNDRDKGAAELIEFEEALEMLLRANQTLNGAANDLDSGESVNDEGAFHPVYFLTKELTVMVRMPR